MAAVGVGYGLVGDRTQQAGLTRGVPSLDQDTISPPAIRSARQSATARPTNIHSSPRQANHHGWKSERVMTLTGVPLFHQRRQCRSSMRRCNRLAIIAGSQGSRIGMAAPPAGRIQIGAPYDHQGTENPGG